MFLLPSSTAPATPATRPPLAAAPATANWDAPVNVNRLSTQAWTGLSPELTAAAPNASPETPTAKPSVMPSRAGLARRWLLAARPSPACPVAEPAYPVAGPACSPPRPAGPVPAPEGPAAALACPCCSSARSVTPAG